MPRLLRVADAAVATGISERTLRRLIAEQRLRVVRPASVRVVLIPEDALLELTAGVVTAQHITDETDRGRGADRSSEASA